MSYNPLPLLDDNNSAVPLQRVTEELGGPPLRRQVAQMIQEIFSSMMKVPCTLKAMHVSLLL